MSGAVRGTVAIRGTTKLLLVGATVLLLHTDQNPHGLSASCSECVPCANIFRIVIRNSSVAKNSCACASIICVAGIISWSVESTC